MEMITRLTRRFSRRALPKPNLTYFLWRFVGNGLRTCRALERSASFSDNRVIADELNVEGIVVGPSRRFLSAAGEAALGEARLRVLDASRSEEVATIVSGRVSADERKKQFLVHLASYERGIDVDDPVLKVAIDQKLLEIVASYLGLWPCLHSIDAWLNYPTNDAPQLSQLWHRDPEDLRLIKAFIYLVDVDEQCGPFTYIPRTHPFGAESASAPRFDKKKRITDDRMARVFSKASWRVCTGAANTMILADTLGYHRGGKPSVGKRILITFTYTSGVPITERVLSIDRMPNWISSDIQHWAVKPLLRKSPHSEGAEGKKSRKKKEAYV
jgi:hypothetical protein